MDVWHWWHILNYAYAENMLSIYMYFLSGSTFSLSLLPYLYMIYPVIHFGASAPFWGICFKMQNLSDITPYVQHICCHTSRENYAWNGNILTLIGNLYRNFEVYHSFQKAMDIGILKCTTVSKCFLVCECAQILYGV